MLYQSFIKNNPYLKGANVIIGVSGGVDSMTLLHLCNSVCKTVFVVHVNYQLRGKDSDADQELVESTCQQLSVKCKVIRPDVTQLKGVGINLQEAARELRYDAYQQMLNEENATYILTGHTADDSIETMVFNFFRGTDVKGLTGIKSQEVIKRPLLSFSKNEIYQYASTMELAFREDGSNQTEVYTRNLIRRTILPSMEQHLPNISTRLQVTQQHIARAERFNVQVMDFLSELLVKKNSVGHFVPFEGLDTHKFGQDFLVYWSRKFGFNQTQIEQLLRTRQVGKRIESDEYQILVERLGLQLSDKNSNQGFEPIRILGQQFNIPLYGQSQWLSSHPRSTDTVIDAMTVEETLLIFPLTIRTWVDGDRITYRSNPKESKKLKKLFNDHKLSTAQKRQTTLLVNGDGQIIWVVGIQKSAIFLSDEGISISLVE